MNKIAELLHAAGTLALWLYVEDSDIGLVAVIRALRVVDLALHEVRKSISSGQ